MAPHGGLRLIACVQNRAGHCRADLDNVFRRNAIVDGLALGDDRVVIERDLPLREHLARFAAAGVHRDVAFVHELLIPLDALHSRVRVDRNGAVLVEDRAAERPQPGHKVARAGGVLGGDSVGDDVGVIGLDVGHALLELFDRGGHGVPTGSGQNLGVVDHGDGRHAPRQAELLAVDVADVERRLLKVFLQIILAEDFVPVGQHARGRDGVEDADIGLRQVELLAALRPDEELLRGVGPSPADPRHGVAGSVFIGLHHALEDVLAGLFFAGPTGPDDVLAALGSGFGCVGVIRGVVRSVVFRGVGCSVGGRSVRRSVLRGRCTGRKAQAQYDRQKQCKKFFHGVIFLSF